ncbi:hypothetical protein PWP93_04825 [Paraburkholderia sp. A1RI-2L]|uniref:hypothetical protein n=1 Tax=Paraburkholderia sp. A1RI-2L TaxID=3028367 RepID=UPI003B7DF145
MGGWTRIWVVLTLATSALAGWVYVDNVHYAEQRASDAYKSALDGYDACRQQPPIPQGASDLASQFLRAGCDDVNQPRDQYVKQQAQQRDGEIATAKRDAASKAVSTVGWASGTVGAIFLAVGWIWRGFRKRKRT